VALVVAIVILDNQRFTLPAGVPVVGADFREVEAELETAQAVTPGQGQTVNIAGVEVGEIASVKLRDGKAIIGMRIEPKYDRIYKDASVLLRPKTGLKDMVAELTPGTREAGELEDGQRIPASQTLPDVNLDEILAGLDGDTRAHLQLLLGDGAEGLGGAKRELANTIRRIEPTARDLRRINEALASSPPSSAPPTPCSPPWPGRTGTCGRRCASCPARSPRPATRWPGPARWARSSAPRWARCGRGRGRSGRRCGARARSWPARGR
jgi:hypothetical protein